jgi:hypothetical protein
MALEVSGWPRMASGVCSSFDEEDGEAGVTLMKSGCEDAATETTANDDVVRLFSDNRVCHDHTCRRWRLCFLVKRWVLSRIRFILEEANVDLVRLA